jgi:hypothetical protein
MQVPPRDSQLSGWLFAMGFTCWGEHVGLQSVLTTQQVSPRERQPWDVLWTGVSLDPTRGVISELALTQVANSRVLLG